MFKIEYLEYGKTQGITTNDIKDVGQILINIVNDERTEHEAMLWCANAHWGDTFVNQKYKFSIQCVYDEKHVLKPGTPGSRLNASDNIFMNEVNLQKIADAITKATGVKNEYVGYDNESLTWDFACGLSYMKNNMGKGLYFALNESDGKEICTVSDTDTKEFIRKVVTVIKRIQKSRNSCVISNKTLRNEDILKGVKSAIASKSEWHCRIYDDGCWWIDIERHPYGHIRFWVGFEDKRNGKCKSSIVTISKLNNNGDLRYNTDGIMLKQSVWNKIQSVVKMLLKEKIINIL